MNWQKKLEHHQIVNQFLQKIKNTPENETLLIKLSFAFSSRLLIIFFFELLFEKKTLNYFLLYAISKTY